MPLTVVLVGTRKGCFVLESDTDRRDWKLRGPYCEAWPIYHAVHDADSGAIYAAAASEWHGSGVWRSADLGETWALSSEGLAFAEDGPKLSKVSNLTSAHGRVLGKLRALDMRGEHDEFLPAPAKDEVARAQRAAEPAVDVHEQPVAGRVAVGVVDRLEAVEVEEAERSRSAAAPDPRLLGGQRLGERVAVRRARERVDARAGAFSGEGPLEAAAEPVRPRGDEQQAGREREREPRRRLEDVEEGDEQRRRQEPADDERAPGGA